MTPRQGGIMAESLERRIERLKGRTDVDTGPDLAQRLEKALEAVRERRRRGEPDPEPDGSRSPRLR